MEARYVSSGRLREAGTRYGLAGLRVEARARDAKSDGDVFGADTTDLCGHFRIVFRDAPVRKQSSDALPEL